MYFFYWLTYLLIIFKLKFYAWFSINELFWFTTVYAHLFKQPNFGIHLVANKHTSLINYWYFAVINVFFTTSRHVLNNSIAISLHGLCIIALYLLSYHLVQMNHFWTLRLCCSESDNFKVYCLFVILFLVILTVKN